MDYIMNTGLIPTFIDSPCVGNSVSAAMLSAYQAMKELRCTCKYSIFTRKVKKYCQRFAS